MQSIISLPPTTLSSIIALLLSSSRFPFIDWCDNFVFPIDLFISRAKIKSSDLHFGSSDSIRYSLGNPFLIFLIHRITWPSPSHTFAYSYATSSTHLAGQPVLTSGSHPVRDSTYVRGSNRVHAFRSSDPRPTLLLSHNGGVWQQESRANYRHNSRSCALLGLGKPAR